MKKNCLVLLLIFPVFSFAQNNITGIYAVPEYGSYNLKGTIKEIKQSAATVPGSAITLWLQDSNLEIMGLDSLSELIIHFDSIGRIVNKKEVPLFPSEKNKTRITETSYNYSKGTLVSAVRQEDGSLSDSTAYDYDRRKRISSYEVFNKKRKPWFKYTFTYNSRQLLITIRRKNEENFPVEMIKLKYDEKGILSERQFFDENMRKITTQDIHDQLSDSMTMINSTILEYDADGKLASGIMAVKDTLGQLLEKSVIDKDRKVTIYNTYRYNNHRDIEEERIFANMENIVISYNYKYDEQGNWIDKETLINNELFVSAHRVYIYQ